ncbi:histidine phosphatase family protein [Phenylobacterium sp.]|uniref:SixA phosphatase family protein n=1 Tax=Phenylobacterium sp. TaxID=1871053 RepID=UPI0027349E4C|nr:histidine phosphatase family protein [Phenylobacterium sp.]MDP3659328.1 histidine phosphatase family protein [Phenylobacterium sp.]
MNRLILLRHGEAERDAASGDDFDRHLTARGWREAEGAAIALAAESIRPVLALVSSAPRALETWRACEPAFPNAREQIEPALYSVDAAGIRRIAEAAGAVSGAVMVVGHNPGVQDLAVQLLAEGSAPPSEIARMERRFPTGAAAVFAFHDDGAPVFEGLFLAPPGIAE